MEFDEGTKGDIPTVPEWFAGQHVLVTGATGFIGKVLVEKLLRGCPNVARLYLVVRPKRDRDPQQRLEDIVNSPIFASVSKNPELASKLRCVSGDLTKDRLQLSPAELQVLRLHVTSVFHVAASVRFDQPLRATLQMNTGGTLKVLELAKSFPKLRAFVYVSTSYCHCNEAVLEEKAYKAPHDPRKILDLTTWMGNELLELLTPKLLQNLPNTYAYTKCLTEQLVTEHAAELPVAIVRPSVVTAAWKEPFPGWVDNLNGLTGLIVGAGTGVIRSMHCLGEFQAELVPVDVCINSIILTAWKLGTSARQHKPLVINVTPSEENSPTWRSTLDMGRKHFFDNPFSMCLWYPSGDIRSSYFVHMLAVFFFHKVPAYLVDLLLMLSRNKPFLVKLQKRVSDGLAMLQYYTTRPWKFRNKSMEQIYDSLTEEDKKVFYATTKCVDWDEYILAYVLGIRYYYLKDSPTTLPRARIAMRRLYYLNVAKNVFLVALFGWFLSYYFWTVVYWIEKTIDQMMV